MAVERLLNKQARRDLKLPMVTSNYIILYVPVIYYLNCWTHNVRRLCRRQ